VETECKSKNERGGVAGKKVEKCDLRVNIEILKEENITFGGYGVENS
jgi:hypothetical protein